MIPVLVTGARGQLGLSMLDASTKHHGLICHFTDLPELDICDGVGVHDYISQNGIRVVVNAAAYTAVDKAESEPDIAFHVNETGVRVLAEVCQKLDRHLIHISTDYVFDGMGNEPYGVDHPTNPISAYGHSKLAGELAFMNSGVKGSIIRTSWLYGEHGNNFIKTMLRLSKEREQLNVVNDQYGSPTYSYDLADAILSLIPKLVEERSSDVLHYCNLGETTWYEFASTALRLAGRTCLVHPISTQEYPTAATRPQFSVLDTTRIVEKYHLHIPAWEESLKTCLRRLDELR